MLVLGRVATVFLAMALDYPQWFTIPKRSSDPVEQTDKKVARRVIPGKRLHKDSSKSENWKNSLIDGWGG